jgi:hypothetical protein
MIRASGYAQTAINRKLQANTTKLMAINEERSAQTQLPVKIIFNFQHEQKQQIPFHHHFLYNKHCF